MTINKNNLPRCSTWDVRAAGPKRVLTQAPGVLWNSYVPDPALVMQQFQATWQMVRREVVAAIVTHYRLHWSETFPIVHPRTAAEVLVRYLDAPKVTWLNPVTATVAASFEAALAHE